MLILFLVDGRRSVTYMCTFQILVLQQQYIRQFTAGKYRNYLKYAPTDTVGREARLSLLPRYICVHKLVDFYIISAYATHIGTRIPTFFIFQNESIILQVVFTVFYHIRISKSTLK